jgi:hypothetical protein
MKKIIPLLLTLFLAIAPALPAGEEEEVTTNDFILRSAVQLPNGWLFSVENLKTQSRSWVRSGDFLAGYRIMGYDPETEKMTLGRGEERITLGLEAAGSSPAPAETNSGQGGRPADGTNWRERRAGSMGEGEREGHTAPPRPIDTMNWGELENYRRQLAEENRMLVVTRQADGTPAYMVTRLPRPWDELPENAQRRMDRETYERRISERIARVDEQLREIHPAAPPRAPAQ